MEDLVNGKPRSLRAGAVLASVLTCVTAMALLPSPARACSTFCMKGGSRILFGKNYDWYVSEGLLVVNRRHVEKLAAETRSGPPATWVSRFGSVTFNQYGREFPSGGMNEAGLVVEQMWLDRSRYPEPDSRGALGCLQWIQYQLDTAGSVQEVLDSDSRVRIDSTTPLHYLVADRAGQVATVEFLNGRLVAHTRKDLPVPALTNSPYAGSLRYLDRLRRESGTPAGGPGSLDRFARIAERVREFGQSEGPKAVDHAFETLSLVAQGSLTQWSIVYELDTLRVNFKTSRNRAVRRLALSNLDFGCERPVRIVDLHQGAAGDVSPLLRPYTAGVNLELVRASFRKTRFLTETPEAVLRRQAEYPATTRCLD
jgi:choloylglycine hydrolase